MNFFEHQDRARRNTWRLIVLFAVAVVLITLMVNFTAHLLVFQFFRFPHQKAVIFRYHTYITLGTLAFIGLMTASRVYGLRRGGDRIADELGGQWVDPETTDPKLRRLINVVEEISLASEVPMPFVYVLEQESGINALVAGYSFEDAVVMVSRGALEHLNRDELQGVVAHEFTHILNGDMRLNIRMMGILFGILSISHIGYYIQGAHESKKYGDSRTTSPVVIGIGLILCFIGYIGVFLCRLIRAGISRQREFLADASAVRFTRNPDGIAGALIKISKMENGGFVGMARREEVSHMFFTAGQRFWTRMMSTHPPLLDRIRAIKPDFQPDWDLSADATYVAGKYVRPGVSTFSANAAADSGSAAASPATAVEAFTAALLEDKDHPDPQHLNAAIQTLNLIPDTLLNAARRPDQVEALFPALFVSRSVAFQDRRMLHIWDVLGSERGNRVKQLRIWTNRLAPGHTLPLADLAFPALRGLPEANRTRLVKLMTDLVEMGTTPILFEYCFVHLLKQRLKDLKKPSQAGREGTASPAHLREALITVFSVLADHGHASSALAARAFDDGIRKLLPKSAPPFTPPKNWAADLDTALDVLNRLNFKSKEKLIFALLTTATADGVLCLEETELLRTLCACLGVPVPLVLASSLPVSAHQFA